MEKLLSIDRENLFRILDESINLNTGMPNYKRLVKAHLNQCVIKVLQYYNLYSYGWRHIEGDFFIRESKNSEILFEEDLLMSDKRLYNAMAEIHNGIYDKMWDVSPLYDDDFEIKVDE